MRIHLMGWPGLVGLSLCGLLLAGCATDHGPQGGKGRHGGRGPGYAWNVVNADVFLFLPFDADHNHRFTKEELSVAIETTWREVAHGRAELGLVELRDQLAKIYGKTDFDFGALTFDPDGNARVTRDEFAQALALRFKIMDANEDGVLTPDEFYRRPEAGTRGRGGNMDDRRGGNDSPW